MRQLHTNQSTKLLGDHFLFQANTKQCVETEMCENFNKIEVESFYSKMLRRFLDLAYRDIMVARYLHHIT